MSQPLSAENLTEITYASGDSWEHLHLLQGHASEPLMAVSEATASKTDDEKENELVQISKSEYEEIKDRVSAIETRISKEFTKIQSSMDNSLDSVDMVPHLNGPERVLEKFERTLEETEMMNATPTTEHLARRLSRDLKIRRSAEHKVIRSPSARRIGNIRRRSQENMRVTRNQSWHLGPDSGAIRSSIAPKKSPSPLQESKAANTPPPAHLKSSLKRGRPNTVQSGLRQNSSKRPDENVLKIFVPASPKDAHPDLQNEKWISANIFFDDTNSNVMESAKGGTKPLKPRVGPKRLNMEEYMDVSTPPMAMPSSRAPRSANSVTIIDVTKTPMLPPRLPVIKKTPGSMLRTPQAPMPALKSHLTPLWQQEQQQLGGRASIARLRSQNAGMVMAKAKLFDELVIEPKVTKSKVPTAVAGQQTKPKHKSELDTSARSKTNSAGRKGAANGSASRRNPSTNCKSSPIGVQRRQISRPSRNTPSKKSPAAITGAALTLNENFSSSPMTRRMAAIDSTPQAKRATAAKHPRRLVRTPQGKKVS